MFWTISIQQKHTKVENIQYSGLSAPQEYPMRTTFPNKKHQLLYNLPCRSVNGMKDNLYPIYDDEWACPFLFPQQVNNQEHLLTCKSLITHLSASHQQAIKDVSYSHLFGTVPQQLNITNIFLALLGIRKRLLKTDHEPACEGNITRPED